jgi:hypothetical protein
VDVDCGQLIRRRLKDVAIIRDLHELAPVGGRAASGRDRRRFEWVGVDAYGVRSLRIHRFPYVIHYRIEGEMIVVFAIMFGGRDPSAWQGRI